MNDFLENPEERIDSFSNSISNRLNKGDNPKRNISPVPHPKKNEKMKKKIDLDETFGQRSVQIRISQQVEQEIREILLESYKKTGYKIKFREFADKALMAYISSFIKEIG